jgi:hypothetical protein
VNTRSIVSVAIIASCLVGFLVVVTAPAAAAEQIELENVLSQSSADDVIDVETRLVIPDSTASLKLTLPEGATVRESNGFERIDDRTHEWTGSTATPSIRYEHEGTVRTTRRGQEGVLFVAAEKWALVRTPGVGVSARAAEGTEIVRENTVEGEGVASTHLAYLGPYTEHAGSAAGQEIRLIVPDAADLREDPNDIIETIESSATRLAIGNSEESVFIIAAPTAEHEWASAGIQRGDGGDAWVRDVERVGTARDTWIHEYVHTRQEYAQRSGEGTTPETRWTIEGMADYYAALLPHERGSIDHETFRDRLEEGATGHDDVRLADPETWAGTDADYDRGALVFAHVDQRLRAGSGTTLDAVVADLNDDDATLTQERFLEAVETAGGSELRVDVERYTETTATPPIPTRREHVAAFGGPDVRYAIESKTVSGPYRTGAIDDGPLVVGETLGVNVTAENVGSEAGSFEANLRIGGESVATETGRLAAGESTTLRFEHVVETTGEIEVSIGSTRHSIRVAEPAEPAVTALDIEPATPTVGESVTLRATVQSAGDRPAAGEVVFAVNEETVATEPVQIGDGTVTIETAVAFDTAGEHVVSVGNRSRAINVEPTPTPTLGSEPPSVDDLGGFSPGVAVVALLIGLVLARRN